LECALGKIAVERDGIMADASQLERLKQGVEGWNKWRKENPDVYIDFSNAILMGADLFLNEANLTKADLTKARLEGTHLEGADLSGATLPLADLRGAHLEKALLNGANLAGSDLKGADLYGADLRDAFLSGVYLYGADLSEADLGRTYLRRANLSGAFLMGTDLSEAKLSETVFGRNDLRETIGLDKVVHEGPSTVGTNTLEHSMGKIPGLFLRGCGLSDWEIESAKLYQPGLSTQEIDNILYRVHDLRANQALQINPLFISYSHADNVFVDEIEKYLDKKGIRFWRDIHDATAGRLEKVVDRAIRQNPLVLLVLSKNSVKSDWVEHEARKARELEKELGRDVLCPVALDDAWKDCRWPARLREQIMEYNILNFSKWKDEGEFGRMFRKLIDGLDLFYKEK
jgi:uncharacterized protein YjbI with pentapeptide repeats